jgi:hypothetical protein
MSAQLVCRRSGGVRVTSRLQFATLLRFVDAILPSEQKYAAHHRHELLAVRVREIDKGRRGRLPSFVHLRSTNSYSGESFWPMSR